MKTSIIKFPSAVSQILSVASDATAGAVFKAIMQYIETGIEPDDLEPDALCIFRFAKLHIKLPKAATPKPEKSERSEKSDQSDQSDQSAKPSWQLVTRSIPRFDRRDDLTKYLEALPDAEAYDIYTEYKYLGQSLRDQDPERYDTLRAIHKYVWNRRDLYRFTFDKADTARRRARYEEIMRLRA